jgi:hypothetical protein
MKGKDRPIHSISERQANLQAWGLADVIFTLPDDLVKLRYGDKFCRQ